MAISSFVDAINVLQNPADAASQISALKHLKSEVIGHVERKESLVRHGIVDVLVQILAGLTKSRGKQRSQESNGLSTEHGKSPAWGGDDELRLQSILLLASLAHEGPEFASPILAGNAIPQLTAALSPSTNPPKGVLASLRTLYAIASSSRLTSPAAESFAQSPSSDILFSKSVVQDFAEILAQKSHSSTLQAQLSTLCQLLTLTCITDQRRSILVYGGVLDILAARLAAYRASEPSWPSKAHFPATSLLPPSTRTLGHLLGAIVSIVEKSRYRVARLLYSPAVLGVFPFQLSNGIFEPVPPVTSATISSRTFSAYDLSLPQFGSSGTNNFSESIASPESKSFPPLGGANPVFQSGGLLDLTLESNPAKGSSNNADESTMIPWLFHTMRIHKPLIRVQAAHLLTVVYCVGLLDSNRERLLMPLVVPLLANNEDNYPPPLSNTLSSEDVFELDSARELSRFVLAKLIQPNKILQFAATSGSTLKQVSQTLKDSFEPIPFPSPSWSPSKYKVPEHSPALPPSHTLGLSSLPVGLADAFKQREGALLLIAAIADHDDTHRKYFAEKTIMQCITDSMKPFKHAAFTALIDEEPGSRKSKITVTEIGNPDSVLIAACAAIRSISRCISLLRTSLLDAGLAAPTVALLRHPNVEVLKAASDVACNLAIEFSQHRKELVELGAIKILCEHAHSADSSIRLVSLWCLKHLVHLLPTDVKIPCFEELGPGWLIQILTGSLSPGNGRDGRQPAISMGAANAAGERVDILNATDEPMKNSEDTSGDDEGVTVSTNTGEDIAVNLVFPRNDPDNLARFALRTNATKLREFKEDDENSVTLEALKTELGIQQQGLDFIRNFLVSPGAGEIVDYLFQTLGATCVFDIVGSKLKNPSLGGMPTSPSILLSAVMVLTHIAASAPRHRQQLISQSALLQMVLPLLSHHDNWIRVGPVWMIINLTWTDDQSDVASARQRAMELKKLGFEEKLKAMRDDESIDVKERVSTALEQLSCLLEGSSTSGRSGR